MTAAAAAPRAAAPAPTTRIAGLDGLRGLAALYVVAHHCWLLCFPGYPRNTGPAWTGWLLHGRLAVVFFITLSGFSLAVSPARDGWRGYFRRRARRILPPYWAALALSLVVASLVVPLPLAHPPTGRSVVVYGLLLQDFVAAPAPNGAFWSIAVEAGLYVAFPLLVLLRRRCGVAALIVVAVLPVTVLGAYRQMPFTAQLAPLFAMGIAAAGLRVNRSIAVVAALPPLALITVRGPEWTVEHYFWVDLAVGPAIALFLASLAAGRPPRLLVSRTARRLGDCSYSLYLIHMPVMALISRRLVAPHVAPGVSAFALTVAVAIPASVAAATVFARIFERRRPVAA
ncbi:acyltransferase family protein [Actinoplanes sp. CA-030573]|uniref:acyltransferase family protein n=1 Tax=Actinoplanes sp. CA-030573 TaxID=3239898 RepID=UPI003D934EC2